MPPALESAALGAIQGAAELLPVSSSAHVAMVPWLLGWEVSRWPPDHRKELEVALHTGAAVALAPALWRERADLRTLALSLAPPVILGYAFERWIEERLGGPAAIAGGLLAGAGALAAADARPGARTRAARIGRTASPAPAISARDGLILGLAQAAALAPGVSRTGATLAAARALGFSRAEASSLSFGVAAPVLAGATALKARRLGSSGSDLRVLAAGAASAFASTALAVRVLGLRRQRPLWPYAAERALLAGGILAVRYRRGR